MPTNTKKTSPQVATLASKTMRDPTASARDKSLAASALAQRGTSKQTGAQIEERAGKTLDSPSSSPQARKLAASLVSQSNKKR